MEQRHCIAINVPAHTHTSQQQQQPDAVRPIAAGASIDHAVHCKGPQREASRRITCNNQAGVALVASSAL